MGRGIPRVLDRNKTGIREGEERQRVRVMIPGNDGKVGICGNVESTTYGIKMRNRSSKRTSHPHRRSSEPDK
jgi:hypothetical protein